MERGEADGFYHGTEQPPKVPAGGRMKLMLKYFFRGLVITVPLVLTIYIVWQSFLFMDGLIHAPFPGAGVAVTLALILLVGFLASNFIGRAFFGLIETMFARAPFVKLVYSSIKDLLEAFVGDKRKFDKPVLVSLDDSGSLKAIGFLTREDLAFLALPGECAVYFPQSYNFAGNLVIVPRSRVKVFDADSSATMSFIVSGGVSGFAA